MTQTMFYVLLLSAAGFAQGPRILIVTDLEGVGGVNDAEKEIHGRHDPAKDARTPWQKHPRR